MLPSYRFGPFELIPQTRELMREGVAVPLGGRAFDLLLALIERRGRVVEAAELQVAVWPGLQVERNNLQVQVWALRRVIGEHAIATVPRRGYQWVAEVQELRPSAAAGGARDVRATPAVSAAPWSSPQEEDHAHAIAARLRDVRLMTFTGAEAALRRRWAHAVAHGVLRVQFDTLWWLEAADLASESAVKRVGTLIERGQRMRGLLVMVEAAQTCAAAENLIRKALPAQGGPWRVLATSAGPLGLPGEWTWQVPQSQQGQPAPPPQAPPHQAARATWPLDR